MDQDPFPPTQPVISEKELRRVIRAGSIVLGLILVLTLLSNIVAPYTDFQWFSHDARHPEVFETAYTARGFIFAVAFLVSWIMLAFNLRRAFGSSLVFLRAPESKPQQLVSNLMTFLQAKGSTVVLIATPLLALGFAAEFSGEWNTWLLARHAQTFGVNDPTFGIDLGFFVFTLPWFRALANFGVSLFFLTTLATVGIYAGMQLLASLAKVELSRPNVRIHISLLTAGLLLVYGIQTWLKLYEVGLSDNTQFTGAGYAAMQELGAQRIFAILLFLSAIVVAVNGRVGKPFQMINRCGAALVSWYILGVFAYPTFIQRFRVDPDRLSKEAPFAQQAIKMTRFAYGLEAVDVRDLTPTAEPSKEEVAASDATLGNMRLWDPDVLVTALEGLQGIRPYYQFNDVGIDRYPIDGKTTVLMIGVRDLKLSGLADNAQNWTNQRLRYTHGYGIVVSRIDQSTPDGQPVFLASDIPQKSTPSLKIDEPRIYFSNARDEYAIVDTGQPEVDYPTADNSATHKWKGDRGIPLTFFNRLAFSALLGDGNLLVSPNISSTSRMLVRRNIQLRASKIYPFLQFDKDPYLVVLNGHLLWVLDGYSTSEMIPYSTHVVSGNRRLNYIRNTVKLTIDAYTGETDAYAIEPNDPILKAYRAIYPKLVKDASQIPAGLREHFRYPEDILKVQSSLLASFHVLDPTTFLSNGDAWEMASQRGRNGNKEPIRPFYMQMKLPDEKDAGFIQMIPFTPVGKPNMIGWMAAHCDPASYGKLTLYRLDQGKPIAGPEQIEGKFSATPEISNINRQFNNDQSKILVGNLLVVPIGKSFLYSETLFLQGSTSGIQSVPRLTKVVLGLNDRVVVADTYTQALDMLFGTGAPKTENTRQPEATTGPKTVQIDEVRAALKMLDDAESALKAGDFGKYGELQKQAKERLHKLVK